MEAEWLREIWHDVQMLALDMDAQQARVVGQTDDVQTQRMLAPAVRRLRKLFVTHVGENDDVVEEVWDQFLSELWLATTRVLASPRVPQVVLHAFASLIALFLQTEPTDEKKTPKKKKAKTKKSPTPKKKGKTKKKKNDDSGEDATEEEEESDNEEQAVERSLSELRVEMLTKLLDATKAEDKNVRLRACQMLQIVLNTLDYIEYVLATVACDTRLNIS